MHLACEAAAPTEQAPVLTSEVATAPPPTAAQATPGPQSHRRADGPAGYARGRRSEPGDDRDGGAPNASANRRPGPAGNAAAAGARNHRSRREPEVHIHQRWRHARLRGESRRRAPLLGIQ